MSDRPYHTCETRKIAEMTPSFPGSRLAAQQGRFV